MRRTSSRGFTLLEILLVVAAIAILAGIAIVAINPAKQLAETRNAQRQSDVATVLDAVQQYNIDNGQVPSSIPENSDCSGTATNEICKTDASDCSDLVDLSDLTNNQTYLAELPVDPQGESENGAGYHINKSTNGRVTVCAPDAERSATISVTQ